MIHGWFLLVWVLSAAASHPQAPICYSPSGHEQSCDLPGCVVLPIASRDKLRFECGGVDIWPPLVER
jgi:hypothetical protein